MRTRTIWLSTLSLALLALLVGCFRPKAPEARERAPAAPAAVASAASTEPRAWTKPSAEEIARRLSPLAFEVTQHGATEPAFRNAHFDRHDEGLYVDVVTGEPLFSSRDKFESGTGWPSFTRPIASDAVTRRDDATHGMRRVEVRSSIGGSHLGHVFDDGPPPTGTRYCINSASLRFVPVARLAAEGYGAFVAAFASAKADAPPGASSANACASPPPGEAPGCQATTEEAILAGGCFWGMQDILRGVPGVLETEVGYTGGSTSSPTYDDVHAGATGHAEAVRIVFDPSKLSYGDLLERWFFKMHDPTTPNRQGNDIGSQYRSAIFTTSDAQRAVAEKKKDEAGRSGRWRGPISTEIAPAGRFWPAEEMHQDYLVKHPGGYTCHYLRD